MSGTVTIEKNILEDLVDETGQKQGGSLFL